MPIVAGCLALTLALTPATQASAADETLELESDIQRLSYVVGLEIGQSLVGQGMEEIDMAAFMAALEDVFEQRPSRLTDEEIQTTVTTFRNALTAAQEQEAMDNLSAGRAFLASNAHNEGVEEMPNGVQYRILRAGSGAKPSSDDLVTVHYRGRLLDGTEFDSSYRRGEPLDIALDAVIPGFQAALQAMSTGAHWEVWIPAELAYGAQGSGGSIGPNQALHFELELIGIKPKG